jgi:hypothetical protein
MSALGQKQTSDYRPLMSAIHPKADMDGCSPNVRFVPKADIKAIRQVVVPHFTSLHWAAATGNELILVRIPLGRDPPMSALLLFAAPAEPDLKPD